MRRPIGRTRRHNAPLLIQFNKFTNHKISSHNCWCDFRLLETGQFIFGFYLIRTACHKGCWLRWQKNGERWAWTKVNKWKITHPAVNRWAAKFYLQNKYYSLIILYAMLLLSDKLTFGLHLRILLLITSSYNPYQNIGRDIGFWYGFFVRQEGEIVKMFHPRGTNNLWRSRWERNLIIWSNFLNKHNNQTTNFENTSKELTHLKST